MLAPPAGLLRLLVKLFPLRIPRDVAASSPEALRTTYRKWDLAWVAVLFVLAPICVYALHAYFIWHTQMVSGHAGESIYLLTPDSNFWYAPASVLGIIAACVLTTFLFDVLLRDRAHEYRQYADLSTGMNARGMYVTLAALLGIPFFAIAYFAAHSKLQLTEHEIVLRRIWSLGEERHPYSQVTALREIRDGHFDHTEFVIEFAQDAPWSTKIEVIFPGQAVKNFLSARTGRTIDVVVAE
jgi:hypothetical protein